MNNITLQQLQSAKMASQELLSLSAEQKNIFLLHLSENLKKNIAEILSANKKDLAANPDLPPALVRRLTLTENGILSMAQSLVSIADAVDPVGKVVEERVLTNGARLVRERVPIGVILFIYESRPNVMTDAAGLAIKSGNAIILRGGKEAMNTNNFIYSLVRDSLVRSGISAQAVQQLENREHQILEEMLKMNEYLDLVIPRGREDLIRMVKSSATMPVIAHERGLCHMYIDESANQEMAIRLAINAKTSNPATCNTIEKILIHREAFSKFGKELLESLAAKGVEVRGDENVCALDSRCVSASIEDWDTEYLSLVVTVGVVDSLDQAIDHIRLHSSHLTDSIVTGNQNNAEIFMRSVSSAVVLHNASNRLVDGGVFGLGAELGISTSSVHMRGPMGVDDLTVTRYRVLGDGHVRE